MSDDTWGFADIYSMDAQRATTSDELEDVRSDDWRNILVLGRATKDGVYPETLALVGRARHLADELGCRVEVLLVGEHLDAATEVLKRYPIHNVYRVHAPDYAPIDHTAKILEQVVKKRRPELILVFQSRTGDAVTAYTANRLGVGCILGATQVEMDTMERRAIVTHQAGNTQFRIITRMMEPPQFVSVQRGLFRAPLEDEYANVKIHDLDIDAGPLEDIRVLERRPAPPATLANAERVVIAGSRIHRKQEVDQARKLAEKLDAVFGVTRSIVEQGLGSDTELVGSHEICIQPKLLVTVGVRGSLDFLEGVGGNPTIAAIGSEADDPIVRRAAYVVEGDVGEGVEKVLEGL